MAGGDINRFRIGTCGYSYPGDPPSGWYGVFYPKTARRRVDELEYYTSFFNTVEINSTFYRPATPRMAEGWVKKTPPAFAFAVKVWQKFTHPPKPGDNGGGLGKAWDRFDSADVKLFTQGLAPLADSGKLGILLFQYPASFKCQRASLDRLEQTLSAFDSFPKVVELRHRSWSDQRETTCGLLDSSRTAWAYIDEPKFASSVRQEIEARGDIAYIRLHGRNYQKWWKHREAWERYDYFYQPDEVRLLGEKLKALAAEQPKTGFYVFFNNHARGQAVANALMLQSAFDLTVGDRMTPALMDAFPVLSHGPRISVSD